MLPVLAPSFFPPGEALAQESSSGPGLPSRRFSIKSWIRTKEGFRKEFSKVILRNVNFSTGPRAQGPEYFLDGARALGPE